MKVPLAFFGEAEAGPAWHARYRHAWAIVVGGRVRRVRQTHELTIAQLANRISRVDGRPYSASAISRLERGWSSAPLFVYLRVAEVFDVAPGALLGADGVERSVSEAELTLVRVVRRLGLTPEAAIARLVTSGGGTASGR